jgi:hypothetical protein
MTKINNSELLQNTADALKVQPAIDAALTEAEPKLRAVIDVSSHTPSKSNQIAIGAAGTTSNGVTTIFTPNNDKRRVFYLCSIDFSFAGDSACTAQLVRVEGIPFGQNTQVVLSSVHFDATARVKEASKNLVFQRPLAIEPNTAIRIGNDAAAGTVIYRANITGYYA